jgi:hypothetical protein
VDGTPHELRRHAEHCRHLATSQNDDRTRLILQTMASEFDDQALAQETCDEPVGDAPGLR